MRRPLLPPDRSLVPSTTAILNDHVVDDLATGDTSPRTKTVLPPGVHLIKEIHWTYQAMATMVTHPVVLPSK